MAEPFLVFGSPLIGEEEISEVESCLRSGWLGTGPRVTQFEREFAKYKGAKTDYAAALNSCTAALHVSLIAAGLDPGAEVITTPLTFCATVNAILHAGLKPVLADVDPITQCIDPDAIEAAITPRTQAILPVHFAGHPCDMERIMSIAKRHKLRVIEDCAHAIETKYRGTPAGTFGDFGCFSFYVTKNVATGEGGMILAKKKQDIERAKILALHGMSADAWKRYSDQGYNHYEVVECGFKYNMMDLQAAIGIHQLRKVEENWRKRQQRWSEYQSALASLPIVCPAEPSHLDRHAYHLYTILVDEQFSGISRDKFLASMTQSGIGVGVHYRSLAEHPYYQNTLGWRPECWPNALKIGSQTASLPLSPKLTDSDMQRILNSVKGALDQNSKQFSVRQTIT